MTSLATVLNQNTGPAAPELIDELDGGKIRCHACGHRCLVAPGRMGVCKVRFNQDGVLRVPRGYVAGLACDPIEKKPFYHVMPGSGALSFGMLGCDFHCSFCQNWVTSQALRDPDAVAPVRITTAKEIVRAALANEAVSVTSTYNEPLITTEWAVEVFDLAKPSGLKCSYVSNGNATPRVLDFLRPYLDMCKVDLKGFDDQNYRRLGGTLKNVCETIVNLKAHGIWTEIVTLLVPGFNDSPDELQALTRFIVSVSRDIPWHVTAFHADYRMLDQRGTRADGLLHAAEIGREAGLRYVYAGNLPGSVGDWENTHCPECGELLVERKGFHVLRDVLTGRGSCTRCSTPIPGIWL